MANDTKSLSGYLEVFEGRLNRMRATLKKEFDKTKSERCRTTIKSLTSEARKLKKTLKQVKEEHKKTCPHCGGTL
jgi:DNA anti-recombination protein RmuC